MYSSLVICLAASCWGGAGTAGGSSSSTVTAVIPHCQVFLIDDTEVPAQESGLLMSVAVAEGEMVRKGAIVATLDDGQARLDKEAAELERDAAIARAEDDIEIRFAVESTEAARIELDASVEVNRKSPNAVPEVEIRRRELALHRAELQIDRSRLEQRLARMTAKVHDATVRAVLKKIERRQITAPFDGTVIDVYRHANDWVNAGESVLRIVRLDRLRVDGFLRADEYESSEVADREVTVEVELARGRREKFRGKVVFVNPLIQAGNIYRLRAEVENRQDRGHWLMKPGQEATMTIR